MSLTHEYSDDWKYLDPAEVQEVVLRGPKGQTIKAMASFTISSQHDQTYLSDRGENRESSSITIWPTERILFGIVTDVVVHEIGSDDKWLIQRSTAVRVANKLAHHTAMVVRLDD